MNINYIAMSDIPSKNANSLQIVQMCNAMSLLGHKVNLIIPNLKKSNKSIRQFYGIKSKFRVFEVGSEKKEILKIENLIFPLRLIFKNFLIKKDLIITRNLVVSFFLILLRVNHILELHDDISSSGKILERLFKNLNLLNSNSIKKIVFITSSLKRFISKKYKYNKKNFKILPDATDIINNKIVKIKNNRLKIGYFGSIYKSRGIELISKIASRDKKNDYFIYGGNYSEFIKVNFKYKKNNLFFHPSIPYKQVKEKMKKMDILLMPYTNKITTTGNIGNIINFTSPMKMFDYLGSAKIILSAEIPVLKEILKNNYNSILIKNYTNVKAWINEIDKIKFNQNKFLIIRKNALKTALDNTWIKRAEKFLN